jgi:hypothetical protein
MRGCRVLIVCKGRAETQQSMCNGANICHCPDVPEVQCSLDGALKFAHACEEGKGVATSIIGTATASIFRRVRHMGDGHRTGLSRPGRYPSSSGPYHLQSSHQSKLLHNDGTLSCGEKLYCEYPYQLLNTEFCTRCAAVLHPEAHLNRIFFKTGELAAVICAQCTNR